MCIYVRVCIRAGLNMQVEHHLFPSVNHCHLHKLVGGYFAALRCTSSGTQYMTLSASHVLQDTLSGVLSCHTLPAYVPLSVPVYARSNTLSAQSAAAVLLLS